MDERSNGVDPGELLRERSGLVRLVRGLVSDPDARAEIEQRTVLYALTTSVPIRRLRGFLRSAARGLLLNSRRETARRIAREQASAEVESQTTADPARLAEHAELQRHVLEAVLALPEAQRNIVLLRFHGDLDCAEIAARLGMPEPTVRSQLRRGLARLRDCLDRDPAALGWRSLWVPTIGMRETGGIAVTALAGGILMNGKVIVAAAAALLATTLGVWQELRSPNAQETVLVRESMEPFPVIAPVVAGERSALRESASEDPSVLDAKPASVATRATIHGRILRETTLEPIPAVRIRCVGKGVGSQTANPELALALGRNANGLEVGRSLADGSYRVEDLPTGERLRFYFEFENGLSSTRDLVVREPGVQQVDFELEANWVVRGSVIDAKTRRPIPNASVRAAVTRGDGPQAFQCQSDPNGRFECTVPIGLASDIVVSASAAGYAKGKIRPREDGSVELPLLPATRVEGLVIDERGLPQPSATIRAAHIEVDRGRIPSDVRFPLESEVTSWTEGMAVDELGRFVIEGIPPWSKVLLQSTTNGASGEVTIETHEPSESAPVTITVVKTTGTAEVFGVLSVNGKPMALPYSLQVDGRPIGKELRSAEDGTYRVTDVPAGLARLNVRAAGVIGGGVERLLRSGESAELNLDAEVRTSWIAGRIHDVDGSARILGFTLRATTRDYRVGYQCAASGSFRVPTMLGVGEEAILRVLTDTGYFDRSIVGGDEAIDVVLPERGVVRLRVVDRDDHTTVQNPSLRVLESTSQWTELNNSRVSVLPGDVLEVALAAGTRTLEIDRTAAFYSPVRIVVEAKRDPSEWLVELPRSTTGILRIEIDADAQTVLPRKSIGYSYRPSSSNQDFRAVPLCAMRVEQASLIEIELPVGSFEFAANDWSTKELRTLAREVSIVDGSKTVLRVRRE